MILCEAEQIQAPLYADENKGFWRIVGAIGFATVAFALAGRASFASRRSALQSTIAKGGVS